MPSLHPTSPESSHVMPPLDELMQLFPRVIKGMGRHVEQANTVTDDAIGPRHCAALRHLSHRPLTVGALANSLEVTLPTASGVLATLDRHGLIVRASDPADRRRTIVEINPERAEEVAAWLERLASPLQTVLEQLDPAETEAFVRAMQLFATAVSPDDLGPPTDCVTAQDS